MNSTNHTPAEAKGFPDSVSRRPGRWSHGVGSARKNPPAVRTAGPILWGTEELCGRASSRPRDTDRETWPPAPVGRLGASMPQQQPASKPTGTGKREIPDKLYFRIGEVARLCGVPTYVLRFWE